MAREQTLQYLQSIMTHYQDNPVMLEMYLDACSMELEVEGDHLRVEDGPCAAELLARASWRCTEWCVLINEVIRHML